MDKEKKLIDMHLHTIFSDGELTPLEVVRKAIERKVDTIAITDHDTVNGIRTLNKNTPFIKDSGIEIINGIELSVKVEKGRMHILGYDIDVNNEVLLNKLDELKNNSFNRVLTLLEQIKRDYNIYFSYEDIKTLVNQNNNIGRPDIAKLCVKYGYSKTPQEAFDKYLIDAYDKVRKFNKHLYYKEAISMIKNSGGYAILAHPKSLELNKKEFLMLLKDMIKCGLDGIEVYHYSHSKEEMDYYLQVAKEYNLLISGGSDFHGPILKPDVEIGSGRNNLNIKELSLVNEIRKKHRL